MSNMKEEIILTPEMIKSSSEKLEVIGTFNPAAVRMPNKEILLYVRVVEKLKSYRDEKYFYSPICSGKNKCEMKLEKFEKNRIKTFSDLDFVFYNETKRLTFISYLKRIILDKSGTKIKSIDRGLSFSGQKNDGEFGVEDPRITKIGDKYSKTKSLYGSFSGSGKKLNN